MNRICCLTFVLVALSKIESARIIVSTPQVSSHVLEQVALAAELVRAGHEVYMCFESKFPLHHLQAFRDKGLNILTYHMPENEKTFAEPGYEKELASKIFKKETDFLSEKDTSVRVYRDCTFMMTDEKFLATASQLKFDLAIIEPFFLESCNLILPHYLKIPFICLTNQYLPWSVRSPSPPSLFPRYYFNFDDTTMPSFKTRLANFILTVILYNNFPIKMRSNNTLLEKFNVDVSSWDELMLKSMLFLYEIDEHLADPLPVYPNHISVAGLTCKPAKPLDADFELLMSSNENGVILMSFGSMGSFLPKDILFKLLEAFSRLDYTVIARIKISEEMEIPKNVKIFSWLPQNDIMGHSKLRLFITHCGNNGQHEAMYHGVPMLGFPLFGEQKQNCNRGQMKGIGLTMNIRNFSPDELHSNILTILNNSSFSDKVKKISEIFRSQPMTPQQKAVFWINHVLRFGGDHLRHIGMDMPLYQFFSLDVLAFLFMIALICILVFYCAMKFVIKHLFYKNDKIKTN